MHVLVLLDPSQVVDLVAQPRRPLELQGQRGGFHLGLELGEDVLALALQEHHCQTHIVGVSFAVDQPDAGCATTTDLVLQARARAILEEALLAGPDAEQLLQDVETVAHGSGTGKGAEVPALSTRAAMERQARVGMIR